MSDDDTVDIVPRQQLINSLSYAKHDVECHVFGSDISDLLPLDIGQVTDSRTAASIVSILTAPEVYPACVPVDAAPAIVPPVARITMLGFVC
jgi:hypothetical protein